MHANGKNIFHNTRGSDIHMYQVFHGQAVSITIHVSIITIIVALTGPQDYT